MDPSIDGRQRAIVPLSRLPLCRGTTRAAQTRQVDLGHGLDIGHDTTWPAAASGFGHRARKDELDHEQLSICCEFSLHIAVPPSMYHGHPSVPRLERRFAHLLRGRRRRRVLGVGLLACSHLLQEHSHVGTYIFRRGGGEGGV